ncbi:isoleucyl-tRNA synthetase [Salmonella enterica subsp. enterica serovar Choleraesuis str. 0006]|nr:isoleucyl-tRNA synthetase [Salmonella enterica subsp. enterica serovar Choleraesuis str. 0006]KJT89748.1 isoleucyl-tRNA ligase [Salmonella enterica subsp. enterica serovar Heidelberg str. 76-0300]KJU01569.1 isoleucyl-tRNA ligase [Salmonella enterica subsp. enterica serovar Heidelberg str. 77-1831]KJU08843.1 isoleucyl-tRNA ligase [Salmonella enterica subsp. enterica serovar Heidelberg str. 79-0480]
MFIKPKYGTENLMSDYKSTLNLPETGFPMRGDLAKREPGMLARWTDDDLYGIIRAAKKGKKPSFCMMALHMRMAAFILVTQLTRF